MRTSLHDTHGSDYVNKSIGTNKENQKHKRPMNCDALEIHAESN